jgi:hypothetical protein
MAEAGRNDCGRVAWRCLGRRLPRAAQLTPTPILLLYSRCRPCDHQVGEIEYIHLLRDKDTGKSIGSAFIKYEDCKSGVLAVDNFNGVSVRIGPSQGQLSTVGLLSCREELSGCWQCATRRAPGYGRVVDRPLMVLCLSLLCASVVGSHPAS